jgi:hypothetical protein
LSRGLQIDFLDEVEDKEDEGERGCEMVVYECEDCELGEEFECLW